MVDLRVFEFSCDAELARSLHAYNVKEQEKKRREKALLQAKVDALATGLGTVKPNVREERATVRIVERHQRELRRQFASASYFYPDQPGTWTMGATMMHYYEPPPQPFTFERHNGTRVAIPNP